MRLSGSEGMGKKILKNWDEFSYTITSDIIEKGTRKVLFSFEFGTTKGTGVIVEKENAKGERYIDEDTLLTSKKFPTTLGAYKDTASFKEGLYEVGRRIIQSI